jgi:AcrR family transcriptional regulator
VSIDDITKEAGVAKGSFYRYFVDKADLVQTLVAPVSARLHAAFVESGDAIERATTKAEMFASYEVLGAALGTVVFEDADVVKLYLMECRGPAVGARVPVRALATMIKDEAVRHTERARKHGLLKPFRAEVSALSVIGAVERLLFAVLADEDVGPPLELPEAVIALILDGVRAR